MKPILVLFFSMFITGLAHANTDSMSSPVGQWKTIDDKTGEPKSIVEITEKDGVLSGRIATVFQKWGQPPKTICENCKDDKKGKPLQGLEIIWDVKQNGDKWTGGKILDPKTGDIYSVKMYLIEGGKKLHVRGFMGISLLGRTQVWDRQITKAP